MKDFISESFKEALKDYLFLKNKEYPDKAAGKLVGDRYRLTGVQRMVLFRGVTSTAKALIRQGKLTGDSAGKKLYVDGYNVLFTIMNYLTGKAVFIGNDGLLRDAGAGYGEIEKETFFYKAVDLFFQWLGNCAAESVTIYLDRSVTNNALHRKVMESQIQALTIDGEVNLVPLADRELKGKRDGLIATSDSQIIDAAPGKIIDAARHTLESKYGDRIEILDLRHTASP